MRKSLSALSLSNFHILPDFIIIGAQKGGTTALFEYLSNHPQVKPSKIKEIQFYDMNYTKGLEWYKSHFPCHILPDRGGNSFFRSWITGEASPYYLRSFWAPQRLAEVCRQTRKTPQLIVLLRDPVLRAYSQYQMSRLQYEVEDRPFIDALAAELERLSGEEEKTRLNPTYTSLSDMLFGYKRLGHYAEQLEHWFHFFPKESFLIVQSENLNKHPDQTFDQVTKFLKLKAWRPKKFDLKNARSYPKIDALEKETLKEYFNEKNEKLFSLIGQRFDWI